MTKAADAAAIIRMAEKMKCITVLKVSKLTLLGGLLVFFFLDSALISRIEAEQVGWIKGREALEAIMRSAKEWSADAEAIRLYSGVCKNAPQDGLCKDWRAVVVSRSRKKSAGFYWSKGFVRHADVADYEAQSSRELPIAVGRIKIDSDEALRISKEHGGKAVLENNPQTEIRYAMMLEPEIGQLIWLVLYDIHGTDLHSAKLHAAINAETGKFLQ